MTTDLQQAGDIEIDPQEFMIAAATAGPLHSIYIAQQVGGLQEKLQEHMRKMLNCKRS